MISTQNLLQLSDIASLKDLSQSLALLDAILSPQWDLRYYSFNSRWNEGEEMASMRDGCGDEYYMLFTSAGAILKGFAHESSMTPYRVNPPQIWPGVLDNVPEEFASFLSEPAFALEDTTFCIWRRHTDDQWQHGPITFPEEEDPDGSAGLLALFDGDPRNYMAWAEEYFEDENGMREVDLAAIRHIYQHRPITEKIVKTLNPALSLPALQEDLAEIGYR
jgi:hypothetical protein